MQECLVTEFSVNNEKCFFTCFYRYPFQSHEGDLLLSNINDNHPTCSILIGDFNEKCSKWRSSDKNSKAGSELDSITTSAGYSQLISSQLILLMNLLPAFLKFFPLTPVLHQIVELNHQFMKNVLITFIYGTLNFNITVPPPYYREVWDYKRANAGNIQKAISIFDWQKDFRDKTKNVNSLLPL